MIKWMTDTSGDTRPMVETGSNLLDTTNGDLWIKSGSNLMTNSRTSETMIKSGSLWQSSNGASRSLSTMPGSLFNDD